MKKRRGEFQFGAEDFPMEFSVNSSLRTPSPTITARHPVTGEKVGSLDWHPDDGTVTFVQVSHDFRGHGIATAMWNRAHQEAKARRLATPRHSDQQTEDGRRWAESVPE